MLYFLHELSDLPVAAQQNPSFDSSRSPSKHQHQHQHQHQSYDNPAFGEAFAKQGLPQYPAPEPTPKNLTRSAAPDDASGMIGPWLRAPLTT